MSKWDEFLKEMCVVPEAAGEVLRTMNQDQVEVLIAFVHHYIDVCYDAFAMNFETDAASFVPMLPEAERRNMVDVSDDVESYFRDSLRAFASDGS